MNKLLLALGLTFVASSAAFALPTCKAIVVLNGDTSTTKTVDLQLQNPSANPLVLLADANGVSFATLFHPASEDIDISITPTGGAGTYAKGLQIGTSGLSIIYDNSPGFVATLNCTR